MHGSPAGGNRQDEACQSSSYLTRRQHHERTSQRASKRCQRPRVHQLACLCPPPGRPRLALDVFLGAFAAVGTSSPLLRPTLLLDLLMPLGLTPPLVASVKGPPPADALSGSVEALLVLLSDAVCFPSWWLRLPCCAVCKKRVVAEAVTSHEHPMSPGPIPDCRSPHLLPVRRPQGLCELFPRAPLNRPVPTSRHAHSAPVGPPNTPPYALLCHATASRPCPHSSAMPSSTRGQQLTRAAAASSRCLARSPSGP